MVMVEELLFSCVLTQFPPRSATAVTTANCRTDYNAGDTAVEFFRGTNKGPTSKTNPVLGEVTLDKRT